MSSRGAEAAAQLAEQIDAGELIPSRELIESLSELNCAIARYSARHAKPLKLVHKQKEEK